MKSLVTAALLFFVSISTFANEKKDLEKTISQNCDGTWTIEFLFNDGFPPYSMYLFGPEGFEDLEFRITERGVPHSIAVDKAGDYRLNVCDLLCGTLSDAFEIDFSDDIESCISEIVLYPNPARDKVSVSLKGEELRNATVKIHSNHGNLVESLFVERSNEHVIQLDNYPRGLYVVSIALENGKLVKEKLWIL